MKRIFFSTTLAVALAIGLAIPASTVGADEISSLRGGLALPEAKSPPPVYKQKIKEDMFKRTFKTQPPLVPHKVDKYKINLKTNKCVNCHGKADYKEEEAPMIGKSHYMGDDGKEMEQIHMSRYFCTQCHVPQADAKPLVANTFKGTK